MIQIIIAILIVLLTAIILLLLKKKSFNEKAARNIIKFLLQNDVYEFKRWIPQIKKFNSRQIENLLHGYEDNGKNITYPVKNLGSFKNLIRKFDNFEAIILKWYENEEYYQYLKPLWQNYICIEDINDYICDEQQLVNFLEINSVHYSQWPDKIKNEFKEQVKKTFGTLIYEDTIKNELNEKYSQFKKCYKEMAKVKDDLKNINKDAEVEAQKQYEKIDKDTNFHLARSFLGLAIPAIIPDAISSIKSMKQQQYLMRQILGFITDKNDAIKIAKDVMEYMNNHDENIITWLAHNDFTIDLDYAENSTRVLNSVYEKMTFDLSDLKSEALSFKQHLSTIFNSNIFTGIVVAASAINLIISIKEYNDVSKLTKEISDKNYSKQIENIKEQFNKHINELNLRDGDYNQIIENINKVKKNIEDDKKNLANIIIEINKDIKILEDKKKNALVGGVTSCALGGISVIGLIAATGGVTAVLYGASIISNIISGAGHYNNSSACSKAINELNKIKKEAEKETEIIEKKIEELNLEIKKQKGLGCFPSYLDKNSDYSNLKIEEKTFNDFFGKAHEVFENQNKKIMRLQ